MTTENITCPYCNYVHIMSDEAVFISLNGCKCNKCNKLFKVWCETVVTWYTEKIEQ